MVLGNQVEAEEGVPFTQTSSHSSQAEFLHLYDDRIGSDDFGVGSPGSWPLSSAALLLVSSWASILCKDKLHLLTDACFMPQPSAARVPSHAAASITALLGASKPTLLHHYKAHPPRNPRVLQESSSGSCLMCVALSCMLTKLEKKRHPTESKWGIVQ